MQERRSFGDTAYTNRSRNRTNHFPFAVADRVIIKVNPFFLLPSFFYSKCIFFNRWSRTSKQGNKRTPPRFVGREAVVTTQCLNGWYGLFAANFLLYRSEIILYQKLICINVSVTWLCHWLQVCGENTRQCREC